MEEPLLNEVWKYLIYEDIIQLYQTSTAFNGFYKNNSMWQFLLERDFDVSFKLRYPHKLYVILLKELMAKAEDMIDDLDHSCDEVSASLIINITYGQPYLTSMKDKDDSILQFIHKKYKIYKNNQL